MFCYLSEGYQKRNPDVVKAIKDNKDKYFTNDLEY